MVKKFNLPKYLHSYLHTIQKVIAFDTECEENCISSGSLPGTAACLLAGHLLVRSGCHRVTLAATVSHHDAAGRCTAILAWRKRG